MAPVHEVSRRTFVAGAAGAAFFATRFGDDLAPGAVVNQYPFTLGVASGDPLSNRVVIWTRLAADPIAGGGMASHPYRVRWEVAEDEAMRRVVRRGSSWAEPEHAHSVHVDVSGLRPGRTYWYRFRAGRHLSPIGRTRTAPAYGSNPAALSLGLVSCQRYTHGYWSAFDDLVATDPDLVVHVGDYIYETGGNSVRTDPLPESITLEQYRNRYGLYKSDPSLQAAHALAPWLFTWDDHEVENNYTGTVPEVGSATPDPAAFLARRVAGYKAYWEHMPFRRPAPRGLNLRVDRRIRWGQLAEFFVLDGRQYRSDQLCGSADIGSHCDFSTDPTTTWLGFRQEAWLDRRLERTRATWKVMAQQALFSKMDFAPGATDIYNLDGWDGYPAARRRLTDSMVAHGASNNHSLTNHIVLTGDIHASGVSDVLADYDDPDSAVLGAEFVGTSVGSAGSALLANILPTALQVNPHLKWFDNSQRGWVHHRITADEWRADYRHVDDWRIAGSPSQTATSWVVPSGGSVAQV